MNRSKTILITSILLAVVIVGYLFLRSSEEDKIKGRLNELSQLVSSTDASGILGKAKIISSFQDLFANPVILDTSYRQARGIHTPKELAIAFLGFAQSGKRVELSFQRISVDIASPTQATVFAEADVSLFWNQEEERNGSESIEITLIKNPENDWVIERVRSR